MKYSIEKIDFDKAVKQPWSPETCVTAQVDRRLNGFTNMCRRWQLYDESPMMKEVQQSFDKHFRKPGDETKPELVALRASLPIEINLP